MVVENKFIEEIFFKQWTVMTLKNGEQLGEMFLI